MLTESDRFLVAVAAIVCREDRVLALRRAADNQAGPSLWEVVSGRLRHGEGLLEALLREVREETGLAVEPEPRPVDAYTMARNGVPLVLVLYRVDWLAGEVALSAEHDASVWCSPAEFRRRTTLERLADAVDRAVVAGHRAR